MSKTKELSDKQIDKLFRSSSKKITSSIHEEAQRIYTNLVLGGNVKESSSRAELLKLIVSRLFVETDFELKGGLF